MNGAMREMVAADVPALSPVGAPVAGETIVRPEDHRAAAKQIDGEGGIVSRRRGRWRCGGPLQYSPADRAVAHIKSKFEIGRYFHCIHDVETVF